MERLQVSQMKFHPGQNILIAGKPGSGKTIVAHRFVEAALNAGAKPMVIAQPENFGSYRDCLDVATNDEAALVLLSRACTEYGHVVLIVDRADLSQEVLELLLRASERAGVTVVLVRGLSFSKGSLPALDVIIATGVHQVMTTAEELFDDALGRKGKQHKHWQCVRHDTAANTYEIVDL